ncbi:MAG: M56 family metallopeptidase [Salibacteraceae bacterium]
MLFCLVYLIIFKHFTYFQLNRLYLLLALILSVILPFVETDFGTQSITAFSVMQLPVMSVVLSDTPQWSYGFSAIKWIYLTGVLVGLILLLRSGWKLRKHLIASETSDKAEAFSFFRHIRVGKQLPEPVRKMAVTHENVHRSQWHSIDVMLFALARVAFWFNPFIHIAAKEVSLNHEFIADEQTHKKYGIDYQYSILNHALDTRLFSLVSAFNTNSLIKNRIIMMNKKRSTIRAIWAYGLIVPTTAMALWVAACTEHGIPTDNPKSLNPENVMKSGGEEVRQAQDVDVLPAFPGGHEALVQYFQDHFEYPEELKSEGVEGVAYVSFIVNENGKLSDISIEKSSDDQLEEPALKFVESMPAWSPGKIEENTVKVKMVLPVKFSLS